MTSEPLPLLVGCLYSSKNCYLCLFPICYLCYYSIHRIRPQHKAPLRGACAGSTYSSTPTGRMRSTGHLRKPGVAGGFEPPLQGVCVQPGTCGNPGLRAAISRPYRAYTLIRVLPEIRDYGRMLSAPTGVFLKLPPVHKKDEKPA